MQLGDREAPILRLPVDDWVDLQHCAWQVSRLVGFVRLDTMKGMTPPVAQLHEGLVQIDLDAQEIRAEAGVVEGEARQWARPFTT